MTEKPKVSKTGVRRPPEDALTHFTKSGAWPNDAAGRVRRAPAKGTTKGALVLPTPEEDAEITRAAEADPDNPPITKEDIAAGRLVRGPQKAPTKERIGIRLDADLLEHLRSHGKGWQSRVNDILRKAEGLD